MKIIIIAALVLFTLGCANRKEKMQENESHEELMNKTEEQNSTELENRVIGIVHVSESDCPVYIEAKLTDHAVNMFPINIEDKYKVEGMKIKFTYELSRGAQPENCDVDMVVSLSDVALMR